MANAIKINEGTVKSFKETGGDVTWTPKNITTANGRVSAQLDLGAAPRPKWYRWVLVTKTQTGTVGRNVRPYIVEADSAATTYQDGIIGTADATLTSETALQAAAKALGPCTVYHATNALVFSGKVLLFSRYVSFALWNDSGVNLTNVAGDHEFKLEPIYDEVQ